MKLETWTSNFRKGIELAETEDDIEYLEDKLKNTDKVNRRTKAGREITEKLFWELAAKARQLQEEGKITLPF